MFRKQKAQRNQRRYSIRRNEALRSNTHGYELKTARALKESLCIIVDNDVCNGYPCSCCCDNDSAIQKGNNAWTIFVKADLCAFPVWCSVTDHGEDVSFGVYDVNASTMQISDALIRSVIRDGRIDKTFSYNDIRAIAKEIIYDILDDEKSYENTPSETKPWMTMELPCTETDLYLLLNRADRYFASVKKSMEDALTDGICIKLGISPFEDEFGIAGYRHH
jgi:hypothetical protein